MGAFISIMISMLSNKPKFPLPKNDIQITRFFGLGTHAIMVVLIIAFTPQLNNLFNKKVLSDVIQEI